MQKKEVQFTSHTLPTIVELISIIFIFLSIFIPLRNTNNSLVGFSEESSLFNIALFGSQSFTNLIYKALTLVILLIALSKLILITKFKKTPNTTSKLVKRILTVLPLMVFILLYYFIHTSNYYVTYSDQNSIVFGPYKTGYAVYSGLLGSLFSTYSYFLQSKAVNK